ncbi:hypothetical protein F2Q68_00020364 [Brassica cretica]|uniref:Uncharacterized protein n=1 Tax=Brassica cretica TaxID=69181 RepID=A0A8S9FVW3_BRACR|nr:hypothetical protein F2Q68_00020364 [Brassica cretica]
MLGFCNDINLFCQSLIHGFGDFQELEEADLWYEAQDLEDTGEATRWESLVQTSVERRSPSNNMDNDSVEAQFHHSDSLEAQFHGFEQRLEGIGEEEGTGSCS